MYTRSYTRHSFANNNSGRSPSVHALIGRTRRWAAERQGSRFTSGGSSLYSNEYDKPDGGRVSSRSRPSSSRTTRSSIVGRYNINKPRTSSSASGGVGSSSYHKPRGGSGFNWWGTSTNSGRQPERRAINLEPEPASDSLTRTQIGLRK
uniref:Uncharacterized protein n=1 Tax=Branchiostoma floridae TaxID=7739 RepID=C3YLF7_BRAFL|eukprot:XP_002602882.1 hypothetical protein BRAFLDRAFT_103265 [Branchiostoma floridae]